MLAADRADVIWGQNYFVPVQLARRSRCVITLHDLTAVLFPQTMGRWNRLSSRLLLQRAVDAADVVLTVSRATARLAARLVPRAGPKLRVVYPGLGDGLARLGDDEAAAVVRSAYGLEPGYILSVGTIEPRKDYPTLLKAYDRLSDPPPLVIVGNVGWKSGRPMRQIRLRQATGHIRHIVGASDGVLSALYGAARLLVCPSIYEGFGSPVVEAMACGCPVLCSWTSSLPEVGGRAARYFRPRDVEDLRAKMAELLRNPQALDTMRAAGFEQARRFSYREAATKVLDVFWTLVGVMG
jgi:glycosyltransferase involved in cell wall biosynthesis